MRRGMSNVSLGQLSGRYSDCKSATIYIFLTKHLVISENTMQTVAIVLNENLLNILKNKDE